MKMSGKRQEARCLQDYSVRTMRPEEVIETTAREHFSTPNASALHASVISSGRLLAERIRVLDETHEGDKGTFYHGLAPLRETRYSAAQLNELLEPLGQSGSVDVYPARETHAGIVFGSVSTVDVQGEDSPRRERVRPHITTSMTLYPNQAFLELVRDYQKSVDSGAGEYNSTLHWLQIGMTYEQLGRFTSNPARFIEQMRELMK